MRNPRVASGRESPGMARRLRWPRRRRRPDRWGRSRATCGAQQIVIKNQDWNLERTRIVGLDALRKRRPKHPAVPIQEGNGASPRKTASDRIGHQPGRSDRRIECQRWLVAGNLISRVVRLPLAEVVGTDQVDALRWLDDLDGPTEMAEHVRLRLEALRETAGASIECDQHGAERIEVLARDGRRSRFW